MKSPLAAIRDLSVIYEICADMRVTVIAQCAFCKTTFDLTVPGAIGACRTHFKQQWDTHQPDGLVDGVPFQIVRRV